MPQQTEFDCRKTTIATISFASCRAIEREFSRNPLPFGGTILNDDRVSTTTHSLVTVVLRDTHFWIPVLVLLGGLAVLRWIS